MPLKFERVDVTTQKGFLRVCYVDEFGQPRFFEFENDFDQREVEFNEVRFAKVLIRQVNELLARPRPMKTEGLIYTNCRVRNQDSEPSGFDGGPS